MEWIKVEERLPEKGREVAVMAQCCNRIYYDFREFDPGTGWGGCASSVLAWSYFEPWEDAPNPKAQVVTTPPENKTFLGRYFP